MSLLAGLAGGMSAASDIADKHINAKIEQQRTENLERLAIAREGRANQTWNERNTIQQKQKATDTKDDREYNAGLLKQDRLFTDQQRQKEHADRVKLKEVDASLGTGSSSTPAKLQVANALFQSSQGGENPLTYRQAIEQVLGGSYSPQKVAADLTKLEVEARGMTDANEVGQIYQSFLTELSSPKKDASPTKYPLGFKIVNDAGDVMEMTEDGFKPVK